MIAREFTLDRLGEAEWEAALAGMAAPSLYQSWAYAQAHAPGAGDHVRAALLRDGTPVAMAQFRVRRVPFAGFGVATAAWGPVGRGGGDPASEDDWKAFFEGVSRELVRRRRWQVRFDPPSSFDAEADAALRRRLEAAGFAFRPDVRAYRTTVLDLAQPRAALQEALHAKWRAQLKDFEKSGLTLEWGADPETFARFRRVYAEMWAAKSFVTAVDLDAVERYQRLAPPAAKLLVGIARDQDKDVGAGVFSAFGDRLLYFLGASSPAARKRSSPGYGIVWGALGRAQEAGLRHFDLGGLTELPESGVDLFKTRMSGRYVMFPGRFESELKGLRARLYAMALQWQKRRRAARARASKHA